MEESISIEILFKILYLYLYLVIPRPLKHHNYPIFEPMQVPLLSSSRIPRITKYNVCVLVAYVGPIPIIVIPTTPIALMIVLLTLMDSLSI